MSVLYFTEVEIEPSVLKGKPLVSIVLNLQFVFGETNKDISSDTNVDCKTCGTKQLLFHLTSHWSLNCVRVVSNYTFSYIRL